MKSVHYIYSILFLFLLTACSEEEPAPMMQQAGTFSIEVSDGGFLSVDPGTATRATENGYRTVFTNGDKLGLIVTNSSGQLVTDNKAFTFDGSTWRDAGGSPDITSEGYSYLVYYPYSEMMNGKKTADEIKTTFVPKTDQRNYADYTASDLMIGSGKFNQARNVLKVTLQHAMTMLVIAIPQSTYEVKGETYQWTSENFSDGNLTINGKLYLFWQSDTREMRLLLPASMLANSQSLIYSYAQDGLKKKGTAMVNRGEIGIYQRIVPASSAYTLDCGAVYYADGTILPYVAGYRSTPVGIVCWIGSNAYDDDPLLKNKYSGCNHGLAVALHKVSVSKWGDNNMDVQKWVNENNNPYKGIVNLRTTDKCLGYSNTLALTKCNSDKSTIPPINAIQTYANEHPAPTNSSGWYFPSRHELEIVCWGQRYSSGSKGREILDAQLEKISGTPFGNDIYWSSTEQDINSRWAWYVNFSNGNAGDDYKNDSYSVRPFFAF